LGAKNPWLQRTNVSLGVHYALFLRAQRHTSEEHVIHQLLVQTAVFFIKLNFSGYVG